jgi:hypothetical protein
MINKNSPPKTEFTMVVNARGDALTLSWNAICQYDIDNISPSPTDWGKEWTEGLSPGFYQCSADIVYHTDFETGRVDDVDYKNIIIENISGTEIEELLTKQEKYVEQADADTNI